MIAVATTAATTRRAPQVKLTEHVKGWVAKIGGKVVWLAPLHSPDLAMSRYIEKREAHNAGVTIKTEPADKTPIDAIANLYLAAREHDRDRGKLRPRTFAEYERALQDCCDFFGGATAIGAIAPANWESYRIDLEKRLDAHSRARQMSAIRAASRWAFESERIDRPFRFGQSFKPPAEAEFRKARRDAGKRLFTAAEVKAVLKHAPAPLRCMFLLAINCGFGNTDLASLPVAAIDFKKRLIDFDRVKTDAARVCVLWPETVDALRKVIDGERSTPRSEADAGLVFLTDHGCRCVRDHFDANGKLTSTTDTVSNEWCKFLRRLRQRKKPINIARSFYDARRTFSTIADNMVPRDEPAKDLMMGHVPKRAEKVSRGYVQEIAVGRLKAISEHVRRTLRVGGR